MRITDTRDLWWKSAIVYCLDIETFLDAAGDGTGDIEGLTRRIDYLAELGITCLWLMPFHPSPDRDDGYDITEDLGVDPRQGDVRRVVELLRLYYIWRSGEPGDTSDQVVFPDQEHSIWTKDDATGEWYLHHFYRHQPDLNLDHPEVVEELLRAIGFWLQVGFHGFRVDGSRSSARAATSRARTTSSTRTCSCARCASSSPAAAATRSPWARSCPPTGGPPRGAATAPSTSSTRDTPRAASRAEPSPARPDRPRAPARGLSHVIPQGLGLRHQLSGRPHRARRRPTPPGRAGPGPGRR